MKAIIMQFSPWSIFLPFRPKYPHQQSVLKKPSVSDPPSKSGTKSERDKLTLTAASLTEQISCNMSWKYFLTNTPSGKG
jgi:hypothetical protein